MKVSDLVRLKDKTMTFASGLDSGFGIVIQMEKYEDGDVGSSVCVQWVDDYLWYKEDDLEVIAGDLS